MQEKINKIKLRFRELEQKLQDPSAINNLEKLKKISTERAELEETMALIAEYEKLQSKIAQANETLAAEKDAGILELAREELLESEPKLNIGGQTETSPAAQRPE